jgi:ABC-type glycerol-3-phosphate transport system permease component
VYALLAMAAVLTLVPVVWMVSTSLKTADHVFTVPIEWLPNGFH